MTTALERLKKECPDWPDWPRGAVEATVKMMQEYGRDVAQDFKDRAASRLLHSTEADKIHLTIIETP